MRAGHGPWTKSSATMPLPLSPLSLRSRSLSCRLGLHNFHARRTAREEWMRSHYLGNHPPSAPVPSFLISIDFRNLHTYTPSCNLQQPGAMLLHAISECMRELPPALPPSRPGSWTDLAIRLIPLFWRPSAQNPGYLRLPRQRHEMPPPVLQRTARAQGRRGGCGRRSGARG